MVEGEKRWDVDKINVLFLDDVAEALLAVPLFDSVQDDKLIWHEDSNGCYSVKSE